MADDLSSQADGSLWPTSQGAGNMLSSNQAAMTAPGSKPVTPMPELAKQEDPEVDMVQAGREHLVHSSGDSGGRAWDDVSGRRTAWKP